MYENDIRPSLAGMQNVSTYTIGFGPEVSRFRGAAEHGDWRGRGFSTRPATPRR